jgi:hypothetical protein
VTEGNYVADYVESLTLIIERLETGRYATREKSGIKCTIIPGKDKPAPLDFDRVTFFKKRLSSAERFLKALQQKALTRATTAAHSWDSGVYDDTTPSFAAPVTHLNAKPATPASRGEPSPLGSPTRSGNAEMLRSERDRLHAELLETQYQLETLTANKKADVEAALLQVDLPPLRCALPWSRSQQRALFRSVPSLAHPRCMRAVSSVRS